MTGRPGVSGQPDPGFIFEIINLFFILLKFE